MKKTLIIIFILLLISTMTIGCGKDEPKDIMLQSIEKGKEINSSTFNGTMDISFDLSGVKSQDFGPLFMLSELHFVMDGKTTNDPMQLEANIKLQGLNMDLSVQMKDNKMYIKLPKMLTIYFNDPSKEYIYIDLADSISNIDLQSNQEESVRITKSIIESLDNNAFISENTEEYTLKEGNVSDVVSIIITQENLKPFLQLLVANTVPLLLEQMDQYSVTEEQKAQFEQMKNDLAMNKEEIVKTINELDKYLTLNDFKMTSVIDKDGFERVSLLNLDAVIRTEQQDELGLKMNMVQNINNINEEITFEMPFPTDEQMMDIEELEQMFNMGNTIQ